MGKKKHSHVPHRHLHSRISYLYQAASYLSRASDQVGSCLDNVTVGKQALTEEREDKLQPNSSTGAASVSGGHTATDYPEKHSQIYGYAEGIFSKGTGQPRRLVSHLRAVSLKSQIRLSPGIKHSICIHCENPLIMGTTSSSEIENKSRGGMKPWADVFVITCKLCGTARRFPKAAKRQRKRKKRLGQPNGTPRS